VSVIYILANMYLAVVPLYDIATAESDRGCGGFESILVL
jgi:APA family basic amino acid/polyamine antiporter